MKMKRKKMKIETTRNKNEKEEKEYGMRRVRKGLKGEERKRIGRTERRGCRDASAHLKKADEPLEGAVKKLGRPSVRQIN